MIVEQRTYTTLPGNVPIFLELVEKEGLPIQRPHLGEPLGYFTSESGVLNQIVHLWGFADAGDRQRRRASLAVDAAWIAFVPKVLPLLNSMESRLLVPTAFSVIGGSHAERERNRK